ncbi:MAG: SHOCT domain-containing protein [Clostridia bacterium]|nr:SHOCT domain-containing protein [Clostridia bacterium]
METLVKKIAVPSEQRKRTTFAENLWYDTLEVYDNKVIGYLNGNKTMTWYFKEYTGIDIVKANMNSQFAQVVFLTGMNSKNRAVGLDFGSSQNLNAMNDINRILFCSGMFSFGKTNDFAVSVGTEIRKAFESYKNNDVIEVTGSTFSSADEILKYKNLLEQGIITQEEFDAKKKQLLGL